MASVRRRRTRRVTRPGTTRAAAPAPTGRAAAAALPLLLAIVLAAPFVPILVHPAGRGLGDPAGDAPRAYFQYAAFLSRSWHDGTLPLWNPYIMLGLPFVGEGQASVFHPLSVLYAFLKPGIAMNWIIAISFLATGLFFYRYLRELGRSRAASWYGAATWCFSSVMISRFVAGHLNIVLSFISIPLVLAGWTAFRARGGPRALAVAAIGYGLMILAYYPQLLYIFTLFLCLDALIEAAAAMARRDTTWRREGVLFARLGLVIALGCTIGAVQLLPSLDFVARSFRPDSPESFARTFSFAPENLLTLIAPGFFGSTLDASPARYWGRNLFWEMWIYVGILPLILSAVGVAVAPAARRWSMLACAIVFLILGLGAHTPVFAAAYGHLPLWHLFRGASKNTLIVLLCLVVLSARGFDALFDANSSDLQRRSRRVAAGTAVFVVVAALGLRLWLALDAMQPGSLWYRFVSSIRGSGEVLVAPITHDPRMFVHLTAAGAIATLNRTLMFGAASAAVVWLAARPRRRAAAARIAIALVLADLLPVFLPHLVTFDRSRLQVPLTWSAADRPAYPPRLLIPHNKVPNQAMQSGYSTPFGYTGNTLWRYNTFISRIQGLDPRLPQTESLLDRLTPDLDLLAVDAVAVDPAAVPAGMEVIGQLGPRVLVPFGGDRSTAARAFLAETPQYVATPQAALEYVLSPDTDAWTRPAIERSRGRLVQSGPLAADEDVTVTSFEPNEVTLDVRSRTARELVLCGMFEHNWRVSVNGAAASIAPANYVFRAVQVPAGQSRVVFSYEPSAFYAGLVVTTLGIGLMCLLIWRARVRTADGP